MYHKNVLQNLIYIYKKLIIYFYETIENKISNDLIQLNSYIFLPRGFPHKPNIF